MPSALLKLAMLGDVAGTSNILRGLDKYAAITSNINPEKEADATGSIISSPTTTASTSSGVTDAPLVGIPGAEIHSNPSIIQPKSAFNSAKTVKTESAEDRAVGAEDLRKALPDVRDLTYTDTLDDDSKMETGLYDDQSIANFAALFGGAAARRNAFTRHGAIIGEALSPEGDGSVMGKSIDMGPSNDMGYKRLKL